MGKASWKYHPLADGGISTANQEAAAQETARTQAEDVVYARDYAAIVEALRPSAMKPLRLVGPFGTVTTDAGRITGDDCLSDLTFFGAQWGLPALLRALARAIELETK